MAQESLRYGKLHARGVHQHLPGHQGSISGQFGHDKRADTPSKKRSGFGPRKAKATQLLSTNICAARLCACVVCRGSCGCVCGRQSVFLTAVVGSSAKIPARNRPRETGRLRRLKTHRLCAGMCVRSPLLLLPLLQLLSSVKLTHAPYIDVCLCSCVLLSRAVFGADHHVYFVQRAPHGSSGLCTGRGKPEFYTLNNVFRVFRQKSDGVSQRQVELIGQ